jgi:hypothetical protein
MAEDPKNVSLELIFENVIKGHDEMRAIRGELHGMRDDQTVMIRLLQRRDAELDVMRSRVAALEPAGTEAEG